MLYPWSGLGGSAIRPHFPIHSHAVSLGQSHLFVHCYPKYPRNAVLSHFLTLNFDLRIGPPFLTVDIGISTILLYSFLKAKMFR